MSNIENCATVCSGCSERDFRIDTLEQRLDAMEYRIRTIETKLGLPSASDTAPFGNCVSTQQIRSNAQPLDAVIGELLCEPVLINVNQVSTKFTLNYPLYLETVSC